MKLAHYGEDRLIAELTKPFTNGETANSEVFGNFANRDLIRVGIGDDCAVIGKPRDAVWQLLKTDCIIEGVHFLPDANPRQIGWKALCRAISDIAAMGGAPQFALITIAISANREVRFAKGIYAGIAKAAQQFGVNVVGGETARSPGPLFISVSLTGSVERARCLCAKRSGARAGDTIYVTGKLGGSIRGKHLKFTPRVAEARWLTQHFKLRAMMDLSDGLAADLPRLAAASGCDFAISELQIPRNKNCTIGNALNDGEDYELLFAIASRDTEKLEAAWKQQFPRLSLTAIGKMITQTKAKKPKSKLKSHDGFDHFA